MGNFHSDVRNVPIFSPTQKMTTNHAFLNLVDAFLPLFWAMRPRIAAQNAQNWNVLRDAWWREKWDTLEVSPFFLGLLRHRNFGGNSAQSRLKVSLKCWDHVQRETKMGSSFTCGLIHKTMVLSRGNLMTRLVSIKNSLLPKSSLFERIRGWFCKLFFPDEKQRNLWPTRKLRRKKSRLPESPTFSH